MRRVLVTGGSGFVARTLLKLKIPTLEFVATSRQAVHIADVSWRQGPELGPAAEWKQVLEGIDCVVHLAGRAHLPAGAAPTPYFVENFDGTVKLARDALEVGVDRLIYLSTAKVLGDESSESPVTENALPRPGDPYAASKLAAEQALASLGGNLKVTILRPPLVYGPGVKANFLALLSAVERGVPMPLSSIKNRRSLIGVGNLASAIGTCLESEVAVGRTYHVTDGAPVSTPALVRALAEALGRPAMLFRFPPRILEACGAALGRGETIKRLTRSLELDDQAIRNELGWRAPLTFEEGILETALWYQSRHAGSI